MLAILVAFRKRLACASGQPYHPRRSFLIATVAAVMRTIAWSCICVTTPAWADEEEAHVVILSAVDPYTPAILVIDRAMRESLAKETSRRIVLYSEFLDAQRFSGESLEPEFLVPNPDGMLTSAST